MIKKTLYVDLDDVMADYDVTKKTTTKKQRSQKGFFENLSPVEGAIDAFHRLKKKFNVYILSTAPWSNVYAWSEKRIWVEKHLGRAAFKRLILSHNKGLLKGDYIIDDRIKNGVDKFEGEHIHFKTEKFKNWEKVLEYLKC